MNVSFNTWYIFHSTNPLDFTPHVDSSGTMRQTPSTRAGTVRGGQFHSWRDYGFVLRVCCSFGFFLGGRSLSPNSDDTDKQFSLYVKKQYRQRVDISATIRFCQNESNIWPGFLGYYQIAQLLMLIVIRTSKCLLLKKVKGTV